MYEMRKLLITPAFDRKNEPDAKRAEQPRYFVFFNSRDSVTIFEIKGGEEVEIPASQVLEYKEYILIRGKKYDIMERMNHE